MKFAYVAILDWLFILACSKICLVWSREALECMIYNEEYRGEYLYALFGLNIARRSVYTWSPFVVKDIKANFPEDCTNVFSDEDKQGIWLFEPVENMNLTFHIRNLKYCEYLYSTSLYSSIFNARRKVFTWMYDTKLDDAFKWQLKRANSSHADKFEIWNVKYGEPLYAASYFFRYDNLRRNVFTWNKKQPDSNQFNWFVKCRNGRSVLGDNNGS